MATSAEKHLPKDVELHVSSADASGESVSSAPIEDTRRSHRSTYQKVYNAFGFTKAYNFPLYIICAGAFFAFAISRMEAFDQQILRLKVLRPGLWWSIGQRAVFKHALRMHVFGAVIAAFLVAFQFTPIIRHKLMPFHRVNGYTILILLLVSNAGCCVLLIRPIGSDVTWQTVIFFLIFFTTVSAAMAIYNIRRLQIDQHRAWMLRCMFVFAASVTSRIIGIAGAYIITKNGGWYTAWPCAQIDHSNRQFGIEDALTRYPACLTGNGTIDGNVVIRVQLNPNAPEETGAAYQMLAGPAVWIALILHVVAIELYLHLTPAESQRLRQVSYERQLARGFRNPGYAGGVVERFGDAEKWQPRPVSL